MPCCVKDLLVEVQTVNAYLVLLPLAPRADLARLQHGAGLAAFAGGLQGDVPARVAVKHPEEVVVGPSHDSAVQRRREGTS